MIKILDQEKIQVSWGIDLFAKFVVLAAKNSAFDLSLIDTFQQDLARLSADISNENFSNKIAEKLNDTIKQLNTQMKLKCDPSKYAPFPLFSFVNPKYERSGVLDQLDMVQRTLTEASEAKVLDWVEEGVHFRTILKLFSLVEEGKLHQLEAMSQLAKEIDQINVSLLQNFQLPPINLSAYESKEIL